MSETVVFIKDLLIRDLDRVANEISSYKSESNLWATSGEVSNTAGNLCLHLCGNLKHFIGAIIGKTGYIRQREDEFELKNVSKSDLLLNIEEVKQVVGSSLDNMDLNLLNETYPFDRLDRPLSYHSFLTYLVGHLNYHLGQINYHRRLVD